VLSSRSFAAVIALVSGFALAAYSSLEQPRPAARTANVGVVARAALPPKPAPRPGSVAMINPAPRGHVAIVESVTANSITIIEGDYLMGTVTRRTAAGKDLNEAARQLKIAGYNRP
jgi:hypothetical protein